MLKFFRSIRRKVIDERNLRRYLIYAFGEVCLVVIGILLALQVNNVNENRKKKNLEVETLRELQESLISNFDNMISSTETLKVDIDKSKSLVTHLEARKPYTDELQELFYHPYRARSFIVNRSAFEMLENRGIDIISNKELRGQIVEHYNFSLALMEAFTRSERERIDDFRIYYQTKIVPNNEDSFLGHTNRIYPKTDPIQYEEILNDQIFISQLKWRISRTKMIVDRVETLWAKETQELEKKIIEELQKLD